MEFFPAIAHTAFQRPPLPTIADRTSAGVLFHRIPREVPTATARLGPVTNALIRPPMPCPHAFPLFEFFPWPRFGQVAPPTDSPQPQW